MLTDAIGKPTAERLTTHLGGGEIPEKRNFPPFLSKKVSFSDSMLVFGGF